VEELKLGFQTETLIMKGHIKMVKEMEFGNIFILMAK
jgi:hypothetical protein